MMDDSVIPVKHGAGIREQIENIPSLRFEETKLTKEILKKWQRVIEECGKELPIGQCIVYGTGGDFSPEASEDLEKLFYNPEDADNKNIPLWYTDIRNDGGDRSHDNSCIDKI